LKKLSAFGIAIIIIGISAGLLFYFNPFIPTESITFSVNGINGNPQGTLLSITYNGQTHYYNYSQLPVRLNFRYGTKISYSWMNITPSATLIIPASGSVSISPDTYSMMTRYVFVSISGGIFPNLQSDNSFEITQSGDVVANYQTQYEVDFIPVLNSTSIGFSSSTSLGSISPSAGWYNAGSTEVFTISPSQGYYLTSIEASNTLSPAIAGNTVSTTINGPGIIEAYFNKIPMLLGNPELLYNGASWNLYLNIYNSGNSPITNINIANTENGVAEWGGEQSGPSQINPNSWGYYTVSYIGYAFEPNQLVNFTVQGAYEGQTVSIPLTVVAGAENPLDITNAEIINQTLTLSVKDNGPYSFTNLLVGVYQGSSSVPFTTSGFNSTTLKPGQVATLQAAIPSAQAGSIYKIVVEGQITNNIAYFASKNTEASIISSAPPNIQFISIQVVHPASSSAYNFTFTIYNVGSTSVIFESQAIIVNASNGQSIGLATIYFGSNGESTLLIINPNQAQTVIAFFSSSSLPAGDYYVKFFTTTGYTIQSPTFYAS